MKPIITIIRFTGDFEEIDLRDLSKLSRLRRLELIGPELMVLADSFQYLPTTLTELAIKGITVANTDDHESEALTALGRLTALRSFTMHGNDLDGRTTSVIGSMAALEALDINDATETLLPALGALTGLRDLRLNDYREDDAGLLAALPSGLTRLDLVNAKLAYDVVKLADLRSLTHLDLRGCTDTNGGIIDVGALSSLTSSLTYLDA